MKSRILLAVVLGLVVGSTAARADNITVFDNHLGPGGVCAANNYSGTGCALGTEDQETENFFTQQWDLEAFLLNGNFLSMVGGFDFAHGYSNILSGDIFISTGNPEYGNDAPAYDGFNNAGWNYVIRLNFDTGGEGPGYDVVKIDKNTPTLDVTIEPSSQPWKVNLDWLDACGWNRGPAFCEATHSDWVAGGSLKLSAGLTDSQTGFLGDSGGVGSHYMVSGIDLGFLGSQQNFTTHFTIECGNDALIGKGTTVPEPNSLLLLGFGLMGLGLKVAGKKTLVKK